MSFTQDDVNKLAHLARLSLHTQLDTKTNDLKTHDHSIVKDLSNILDLVSKIKDIKTENIAPMDHSLMSSLRCRADEVTENNERELMQSEVPESAKAAGLYLVPKVVE